MRLASMLLVGMCVLLIEQAAFADIATDKSSVISRWAKEIDPSQVLPEYPRPQMVRRNWTNLNGKWDFALTQFDAPKPNAYSEEILVPFPVESPLSGTETKRVTPEDAIWYRRFFRADIPENDGRLLLHFGAIDWKATVWINGKLAGTHQGGFDSIQLDVTNSLADQGLQEVVIRVVDPTTEGFQAHGKQSLDPGLIIYTAVSGIWQTVWFETVPATYVDSLRLTPDVDAGELEVTVKTLGPNSDQLEASLRISHKDGTSIEFTGKCNQPLRIPIENAHLWSSDDPFLYDLNVEISTANTDEKQEPLDQIQSYFGMRKVEVKLAEDGHQRIFLNDKETFNFGLLDQGWWPSGLYTAPSDEALRYDIEVTKRMGFNMCRKHMKVESARWYYWCDKLGMLVWQDMPNSDRSAARDDDDIERSTESEANFRIELKAMMDQLHNSPAIITWIPFNEGWGQFKTNEIINWVQAYDPTRIVDGPSGWTDRGVGHLHDFHHYPVLGEITTTEGRATVLGEYGGLGLSVQGHTWQESGNWGYLYFATDELLSKQYQQLVQNLWLLKADGLAGAVYTQTTDVEGEINGVMTYDREVLKIDPEAAFEWSRCLYQAPPNIKVVIPNSKKSDSMGQEWQYTTEKPAGQWMSKEFDDSNWQAGRAGFGTPHTPNAIVRTEWDSEDIWLRKTITLSADDLEQSIYFSIHHDEEANIYINGVEAITLSGFTEDYRAIAVPKETQATMLEGENTIAIHCHQETGGQYIDLGLIATDVADIAITKLAVEQTATTKKQDSSAKLRIKYFAK